MSCFFCKREGGVEKNRGQHACIGRRETDVLMDGGNFNLLHTAAAREFFHFALFGVGCTLFVCVRSCFPPSFFAPCPYFFVSFPKPRNARRPKKGMRKKLCVPTALSVETGRGMYIHVMSPPFW